MADRKGFSEAFGIPLNKVPVHPDDEEDPKRIILKLAKRSSKRTIKSEVVSSVSPDKPGAGYNVHLTDFINTTWNPADAATHSPSLKRALNLLESWQTE